MESKAAQKTMTSEKLKQGLPIVKTKKLAVVGGHEASSTMPRKSTLGFSGFSVSASFTGCSTHL